MKKEKKNKVGRPRLASTKIKKESILICLFCLVIIAIVVSIELNVLNIYISSDSTVASVYNNGVNQCEINDSNVTCGANVTYATITINGEETKEAYKEYSNISFDFDSYDEIEVCYETNKIDLQCVTKSN